MSLNFIWRDNTGRFSSGQSLYLGKIRIASYGWNGGRSQSSPDTSKTYIGRVHLPQAPENVFAETIDEIKTRIEQTVSIWFNEVTE